MTERISHTYHSDHIQTSISAPVSASPRSASRDSTQLPSSSPDICLVVARLTWGQPPHSCRSLWQPRAQAPTEARQGQSDQLIPGRAVCQSILWPTREVCLQKLRHLSQPGAMSSSTRITAAYQDVRMKQYVTISSDISSDISSRPRPSHADFLLQIRDTFYNF